MSKPPLTVRDMVLNPGLVLSAEQLAAAHANVAAAPPLSPAQLDHISAVFRPVARQVMNNQTQLT
ncbi:hypothetical protein [Amycolatopsis sp. NPDC059657]|uniref:hypothetical protein n=1 Tax=Amycolatopsis sp. NPDC059657 TaxID=3346899 RepID=UPI003670914A